MVRTGTLDDQGNLILAAGVSVNKILDEDAQGSDDPTALITQQSMKTYVDTEVAGAGSAAGIVIMEWHGSIDNPAVANHGWITNNDTTPDFNLVGEFNFHQQRSTGLTLILSSKIRKQSNWLTLNIDTRVWHADNSQMPIVQLTVGGSLIQGTGAAGQTPAWFSFTLDISGESDGLLDLFVHLRSSGGSTCFLSDIVVSVA